MAVDPRAFRINPDIVIVCPRCREDVCVHMTIAAWVEFGDLIDAASAHECDEGEDQASG